MPTIRPAQEDDIPALRRITNHYIEHTVVNFKTSPLDAAEVDAWFSGFAETGPFRLRVAEDEGEVIGYVGSIEFNPRAAYSTSAATSIYLHPDHRGAGIGTALYTELFTALEGGDIHRLYAGITVPNDASIALHTKMGFREAAKYSEVGRKFGKWLDVVWMERAFP